MEVLFSLAVAIFAGLMLSRLAKLLQLPAVTAYLVAGILIGPFCLGAFGVHGLGFVDKTCLESMNVICDVALGFIAFSIGSEFRLSNLKTIGKQATVIGIIQAVSATLCVDAALIGFHFIFPEVLPLPAAIILGAVASATAPAATLMVVRQYRAKGPLTDILLPIVALDDAVGLVLFSVSFGIAKGLISGSVSLISILLEPIIEVVASIILGAGIGFLLSYFEKFFFSRAKRLTLAVCFVLLTVATASLSFNVGGIHIAFSPLLTCMMVGTIFCNVCDFSESVMDRLDRWTAPIFVLFFVISGAELDLSVVSDLMVVLIGVVYMAFRCIGKYFGAGLSASAMKCSPAIRKYLGITLFPQAGVALGMASIVSSAGLGEIGILVQSITLFSVLIYELVGPYLTKISLIKAGEVELETKPEKLKAN